MYLYLDLFLGLMQQVVSDVMPGGYKLFQDGVDMDFQDGTQYEFQA